jgi:hypothetical protein
LLLVAQQRSKPKSPRFENPSEIARDRRKLPDPKTFVGSPPEPADSLPRALGLEGWTIPRVLSARQDQSRGLFQQPARLLRSAKTDAAVFAALLNRIAPQMCLPMTIDAGSADGHAAREGGLKERAVLEAREQFLGDESAISPQLRAEINETIAAHGVCVCQNVWLPRKDGKRVDVRLELFPIEFVRHFEIGMDGGRGFYALTYEGKWVPIVHGDEQWVIFQAREMEPWSAGALMPLSKKWADRAFAEDDRARNAQSHGDSKWIGMLPQGVKTESEHGKALLAQMQRLYEYQRAMLKPYGSEVARVEAMSQNWQIFREIITQDNADVFKILTGQDARGDSSQRLSLAQLFGVSQDVVGSDLQIMQRGLNTGTVRPWQQKNFGRVDLVKGVRWLMPDPEEDARRESISKRWAALLETVKAAREQSIRVDQAFVTSRAEELGLKPPTVETLGLTRADISPDDIKFGVVTINEVRATLGLAPIAGGDVTVPQSATVAKIATSEDIPPGTPPAPGGGQPQANGAPTN